MNKASGILLIILAVLITACGKDEMVNNTMDSFLRDFEKFPEVPYPKDNPNSTLSVALGKLLFYDTRLSVDGSISCGSCHKPDLAFSDNVSTSPGVAGAPGKRNAPSLANVAYHPYYTREGGVPSLEMQVLVPIQEHNEFNFNIVDIEELLSKDSLYHNMSMQAYGRALDAFVLVRAISNFERTFISNNSRFDQYVYLKDERAMTSLEREGMQLFFSDRTQCSGCHSGFNFTNYAFENNGLYENYADNGRERLTSDPEDRARFKVPSLRNIALTGPYMHDGSFANLEEVVEHYNSGGKDHPNKSTLIQPLHLSKHEKQALLAFLQSLTDESFIENTEYKK